METVSNQVDSWIHEMELPSSATLKPIRQFDGLYPEDPIEAEAYWDFIGWFMQQEDVLIMGLRPCSP